MNKNIPYIPISIGELIDKITILKIKKIKITDSQKSDHIHKELSYLEKCFYESLSDTQLNQIKNNIDDLQNINNILWEIEDTIRKLEDQKKFDTLFIETARKVYIYNDKRASIKKNINILCESEIIEEKSYV